MINITMYRENSIRKEDIISIVDLLHEDYGKIEANIHIIGNSLCLILLYLNGTLQLYFLEFLNFFFLVLFKRSVGCENNNQIFIFTNSILKEEKAFKKIIITSVLLHELRHAYQYKYNNIRRLKNFDYSDYISYGKGYESQYIERDANKFSTRMLNKHMEDIYKILDLDFIYVALWCDDIRCEKVGKGYFNENNK